MMRQIRGSDWLEMAGGMRQIQRQALLALTDDATPVRSLLRISDSDLLWPRAFERGGELIALAGAAKVHPGVASTFMYSTDAFHRVVLEVTRHFKELFEYLREMDYHRIHSLGPANDPGGRRWKEDILGAWPEAHLEKFGKNGEDFILHSIML
jgi:hypothetical protein